MRQFVMIFLLLSGLTPLVAQPHTSSFTELDSLQAVDPKPAVIFIHTNWCRYCEGMQRTTLRNDAIVKRLDSDFYYVSLDAESTADIQFAGHTFRYRPSGTSTGMHELAWQLGQIDGRVSYPTLCVLSPTNEILWQETGFIRAKALERVLEALLVAP